MSDNDPPVAADDFPEFAEPPRHKPGPEHPARAGQDAEAQENEAQAEADAVIARLRQKRGEGRS
jgi:hypothetical protein